MHVFFPYRLRLVRIIISSGSALLLTREQLLVTGQPGSTHSPASSTETTKLKLNDLTVAVPLSAQAMSPKASEEVEVVVATTAHCDNSSSDAGSTATRVEPGIDNSTLATPTVACRKSRKPRATTASDTTAAAVASEVEAVATSDASPVGKSSPNIASTDGVKSRSKFKNSGRKQEPTSTTVPSDKAAFVG